MQMVNAMSGFDGTMSQATRTFMTRDIATGTGDSNTLRLSDADTTRVRALAGELLKRCVR